MKILIVDDEPFVLKVLARTLANHGFEDVSGYQDAQAALTALRDEPGTFDLAFIDLNMPGTDGVELLRHLAQLEYRGGLVLISGTDGRILDTAVKLAREHGLDVVGALGKPILPAELGRLLAERQSCAAARSAPVRKAYDPQELHRAIGQGELVNFYQPKVELLGATVVGVESLARWQHPDDGLVFPDQFIPIAEQHGLIDALTRTVLRRALADATGWRGTGVSVHLAVNVSMDNLTSLELPDFVAEETAQWGFPPSALMLEVTESRLMQDPRAPLDVLTRMKLKGIGLSIDDFGTGYSSLAQLREFPFDELKVDRGFVHGACRDASLRSIYEASHRLASELGLRIVAEGVEDAEDWAFLRATGCDMAQGYFIAKPMPAADLPSWVAAWESRRVDLLSSRPASQSVQWNLPSAS